MAADFKREGTRGSMVIQRMGRCILHGVPWKLTRGIVGVQRWEREVQRRPYASSLVGYLWPNGVEGGGRAGG
jgi:hypothetical protein